MRYEFTADTARASWARAAGAGCSSTASPSGENRMEHGVPLRFTSYAGMDIGKDNGDAVSPTYEARSPFAFTGKIGKVVFDLSAGTDQCSGVARGSWRPPRFGRWATEPAVRSRRGRERATEAPTDRDRPR